MYTQTAKIFIFLSALVMTFGDICAQSVGNQPINTQVINNASTQTTSTATQNTTATPLPKVMILPWQTPSVDVDTLQRTAATRMNIMNKLKQAFAPDAAPLSDVAPANPAMESARYTLRDVLAQPNANVQTPVTLFPLWTRIHDYDFFALVVIDSGRNTIKTVLHKLVPHARWKETVKSRNYADFFAPSMAELMSRLNLSNLPSPSEDIAVAFRDLTASQRPSEIDRSTLALMLAAQWGTDITTINPIAAELMATIHEIYGQSAATRKANREIILRVTYNKPPLSMRLPAVLDMNVRGTEAVFGQSLPWKWNETLTVDASPDGALNLTHSGRLKKEILTERASLVRAELPQVVKIRGAWAYVDKGRAWGLQMNDRLISNDDPQKIKGHVVAYFGPEMKLSSPRGWPIHEGAIIFIRKGQKDVRVGQILTYDGMKVPTPWPPGSGSTTSQ
jgi:hypothetical protein